jgi:hypothetical protein
MRCFFVTLTLAAFAALLLTSQVSCSGGGQPGAYQRGCRDGAEKVRRDAALKYADARGRFEANILLAALAGGALIFFGPGLSEAARKTVTDILGLSPEAWSSLTVFVYMAVVAGALIWCAVKSSGAVFSAVGVLAAFSVHPFWFGYLPAVKNGDAAVRKLSAGKLKSLLMLAVIIVLVERILSRGF